MGHPVTFAPSARRDLRDIVRYISVDSPERAVHFGQLLISSTRQLADSPLLGRVVPEFDDPSIREIVVRPYRVIYQVKLPDRHVSVIRFWHSARSRPDIEGR